MTPSATGFDRSVTSTSSSSEFAASPSVLFSEEIGERSEAYM